MFKKRYLFLILVVCLFAVSAVSAQTVNDTGTPANNHDSVLMDESMDKNLLSMPSGGEEIRESAADACEGSIINLENDYDSGFLSEGITIDNELTINPAPTKTSLVEVRNITVGDVLTVTADVNASEGFVTFEVGTNTETVRLVDNKASCYIHDLSVGSYNITATFNDIYGDYLSSSDTKTFNVNKAESKIEISVEDFYVDQSYSAIIVLNYDATGDVIIYIDGKEVGTDSIYLGCAGYVIQGLNAGEHTIEAVYNGDDYYLGNSASAKFNVIPLDSFIDIERTVLVKGEDLIFYVPYGATGIITLSINNKTYNLPIEDSMAIFNTSVLSKGEYPIDAYYSGDDWYSDYELTSNITINVNNINAPDVVKYYNGPERFVVTITDVNDNPLYGQLVTIVINGVPYTRDTDYEGHASIAINLNAGFYEVLVKYDDINVTSLITVLSTVMGNDVVKVYKSDTQYYAAFIDTDGNLLKNTDVTFYLEEVFYRRTTDENGVACMEIDLMPGEYGINAINPLTDEFAFNYITVITNIVENYDSTRYYNESNKFSVKILDSSGSPASGQVVKFTIGDKTYESTTDSNGYAFLNDVLQPGTYTVTTTYGDFDVNNTINVLPTLNDMQVSSSDIMIGENEVINVVLPKKATGKVNTTINNKEYSANVKDGIGNIVVSNLNYGIYDVEVTYSGDSQYNSVKEKTSFKVDANIDLIVPDLTKYYRGPERFVVTVKDKDNMPLVGKDVTINLNNVSYTRTTDSNGHASMAINLNSGVYNVTSEYEGVKVDSKITVKSTVSGSDVTKIFRNGTQYYATFVDSNANLLKNTDVKFNINGVFYTRTTNDQGVAKMNINLPPGTYVLTAENPGSMEKYTNVITVLPSIAENYDLTKYYKSPSKYTLRIIGDDGRHVGQGVEVKLNINGVFYTRTTDPYGYINMNINLPPGTYTVTAEYNGLRASNTINVLSVLQTNDLSMKFRDESKFEAKLLDGQGNPYPGQTVTFNINGVFYERVTDEYGIARLSINLPVGDYIITSSYNGLNAANHVNIAPFPIYYTIGNNPLDYDYYGNEYNKFSWDWHYSPQWEAMVRMIYDVYGNQGMEIQDQYVHYGVKYVCWEQSTGYSYTLNKNGEVIAVTNMMDYYVQYKEYDYNNNEII